MEDEEGNVDRYAISVSQVVYPDGTAGEPLIRVHLDTADRDGGIPEPLARTLAADLAGVCNRVVEARLTGDELLARRAVECVRAIDAIDGTAPTVAQTHRALADIVRQADDVPRLLAAAVALRPAKPYRDAMDTPAGPL